MPELQHEQQPCRGSLHRVRLRAAASHVRCILLLFASLVMLMCQHPLLHHSSSFKQAYNLHATSLLLHAMRRTLWLWCSGASSRRVPVISLQVLFPEPTPAITEETFLGHLRGFHRSMAAATFAPAEGESAKELVGVAQWAVEDGDAAAAPHRIDVIVRHDCPLPSTVADQCITHALYPDSVKEKVRAAQSTAYLAYRPPTAPSGDLSSSPSLISPMERYVALSAVAGALAESGAIGILNLNARTSIPGTMFRRSFIDEHFTPGHTLDFFRALPRTTLFCGLARYRPDCAPELYGFRTHAAELLGLPNLAAFATQPSASDVVFYVFHFVWDHMMQRGSPLQAGERFQLTTDEATSFTVRAPTPSETYLQHPPQSVIVLEPEQGWEAIQASLTAGSKKPTPA